MVNFCFGALCSAVFSVEKPCHSMEKTNSLRIQNYPVRYPDRMEVDPDKYHSDGKGLDSYKVGPLPDITWVITPITRVTTPVT